MDSQRRSRLLPAFNLLGMAILLLRLPLAAQGAAVFRVKGKFDAGTPMAELKRHDELRHGRLLHDRLPRPVDVYTGGNSLMGYWYTNLAIGTPPRHLQVEIDTGSPVTWVSCEGCVGCPKSGAITLRGHTANVKMETYNPKLSKTARIMTGDESLCDKLPSYMPKNSSSGFCDFKVVYADNSTARGYYVTDLVSFTDVSSNPTTGLANVTFGCATMIEGWDQPETSFRGVEGLIGLSPLSKSILDQMTSTGKVRKEFAHCFDEAYGGIFAIGHVVKPKMTTMTPFLKKKPHSMFYTISVTAIEVGVHSHIHQYPAIVDTGTTLISLPKVAFDFAIEKIFLKHPNFRKEVEINGATGKLPFLGSLDAEFPTINLQVNMSHALKLYPHDYFRAYEDGVWTCTITPSDNNDIVIGNFALRNKLFIYNLENMELGWQEYNCASSIELEDEDGVCNIGAHQMTAQPNNPEFQD